MTMQDTPVAFEAVFRPTADRAAFDGAAQTFLMYGALKGWETLMKTNAEEVLDRVDAGECVSLKLEQDGCALMPFEYERGPRSGQYYAYVRARIQNPTSTLIVGVIERQSVGPNDYRWAIAPVAWSIHQKEGEEQR